jgi:hypothetical protein
VVYFYRIAKWEGEVPGDLEPNIEEAETPKSILKQVADEEESQFKTDFDLLIEATICRVEALTERAEAFLGSLLLPGILLPDGGGAIGTLIGP